MVNDMEEKLREMGVNLVVGTCSTLTATGSDKVLKNVKKFLDQVGCFCDNDTYICGVKTPAIPKNFGDIIIHRDQNNISRYFVHAAE